MDQEKVVEIFSSYSLFSFFFQETKFGAIDINSFVFVNCFSKALKALSLEDYFRNLMSTSNTLKCNHRFCILGSFVFTCIRSHGHAKIWQF